MLTEGRGLPIATILSGAKRTDMQHLADLLDATIIADPVGAAERAALVERHRCLDRGDDYSACRAATSARGSIAHLPPEATAAQPLPPPGHPDRHPPPGTRRSG